ncbi:MFS transporter, UMF1 family [Sporothrix brasiliensis 5110]|uniref:Autophagy-related protein n=1 Tax=Sporothrix brasiliensis 5110 TaxID=1398154 RepID=A0A0C2J3W7_9PEZI|nr:MFS transporter, UMF1 family [Sporothrix brasiliensis 5110]KIH91772.1 MFS transporter, UMF1 family [Sporothrix brasiliensis 5110]
MAQQPPATAATAVSSSNTSSRPESAAANQPPSSPPHRSYFGSAEPSSSTAAAAAAVSTTTQSILDDIDTSSKANTPRVPHSHSSSFEADDERSATGGRRSFPSTATNSIHEGAAAQRLYRHRDSDNSSDYHPGEPFRMATGAGGGAGGAGGDGSENSRRPRRPSRPSRRRGHRHAGSDVAAAYASEDNRPTSNKEILGWYMYAFASETYVICAIASFIPILLESLARENGVLLSDRTTPCQASNAHPASSPASSLMSALLARGSDAADSQCVVYVLGIEINTASFAMYTFSVSVLLQALIVVSISCAADHGNYRKTLLLAFAWTGSVSVMLYLAVSAKVYIFGALLAIISNTSFGASFVLLNSFLPLLVRHHPSLLFEPAHDDDRPRQILLVDEELEDHAANAHNDPHDEHDGHDDHDDHDDSIVGGDDASAALLGNGTSSGPSPLRSSSSSGGPENTENKRTHEELTSLELSLSTQISSKGIGIGYCAALFVQCIAILIVFKMHNTLWSQRIVLFFIGFWWAFFTIPAAMWLRPRPGPPLPDAALSSIRNTDSRAWAWVRSWLAYLGYAWASLFRTIRLARRLIDIVLFLAGWFLLSDAIATTSSTAVLFAKTQLHMEVWALGLINVISTITGVIGAFSWAFVSRRLGLKPLHTILACLALFELIPIYGLAGYLPFVRSWGVGGLQQPWEMYPLAAIYGLVLGGLSSYCRSLYGELIPPGSEAAFYALYAITDKGSSVFGPAIVGAIIDASGEIRPAFWFLACLVGLPAPLLYCVNVERGKREGERLAAIIEGYNSTGSGDDDDNGNHDEQDTDDNHTPRAILGDYEDEDDVEARR